MIKRYPQLKRSFTHRQVSIVLCTALATAVLVIVLPKSSDDPPAYVVSMLYDMDSDGEADHVAAYPSDDKIEIVSGRDEALIATITGSEADDLFAYSVAIFHDLNDDDRPDILVGAPNHESGLAYIFEGPFQRVNNQAITISADDADRSGTSPDANDYNFGERVAPVTDMDDDGVQDIRIRAWFNPPPTEEDEEPDPESHTYIFSGTTGRLLYVITGDEPFDPWQEIEGDVDGDADVDQKDVDLVLTSLGITVAEPTEPFPPDVDENGIVDGDDLAIVVSRLNANPYDLNFYSVYLCPASLTPWHYCHGCGGSSYVMPLNAQRRTADCNPYQPQPNAVTVYTSNGNGGGDWFDPDTWTVTQGMAGPSGVPGVDKHWDVVRILPGDTVTQTEKYDFTLGYYRLDDDAFHEFSYDADIAALYIRPHGTWVRAGESEPVITLRNARRYSDPSDADIQLFYECDTFCALLSNLCNPYEDLASCEEIPCIEGLAEY